VWTYLNTFKKKERIYFFKKNFQSKYLFPNSKKNTTMRQIKIGASITKRDSETMSKFLVEISRIEMITVEEEVELAQRIKKGDQKALNKLVSANLRFVVSVAKQYQNQGLSLSDLVQEGNMGLTTVAMKFDETRGFKFISYAVWWIRQSILQALAEQSRIVRLPLNQVGLLNKIKKTITKFEQDYERTPSAKELSEILDIPEDKIGDTLKAGGRHTSVDAPFAEGEDNTLLDVMTNEDSPRTDHALMSESLSKETSRVLMLLSDKERQIILKAFGIGGQEMSLEEIGDEMGLTRERVRQIREKALKKLRENPKSKLLKSYMG
jgi:RNA polymerase primary sigma factor